MTDSDYIYLDHSATTPILPEVADAMQACYFDIIGNPSSLHSAGRKSRRLLEDTRDRISELLNLDDSTSHSDRLIFTSGGTESNNLAIRGLAGHSPGRMIISAIEHPSVVETALSLTCLGFEIVRCPADSDGVTDVEALENLITDDTRLVCIMLGNNETGVIQPVSRAAEICERKGVLIHTDAVHAVGKLPVDFTSLNVSTLSLSAHKFHGPKGIGALVVKRNVTINPIVFGGFQQSGLRPGTEPVPLAVGLLKALEIGHEEVNHRANRATDLRIRFEGGIKEKIPDIVVNAEHAHRLPHTSNISFFGLNRQSLLMALDEAGIACSTGSACSSGSTDPSPVLLAMGCPAAVVNSSIRFSLGATTTTQEVDSAIERISRVVNKLRKTI